MIFGHPFALLFSNFVNITSSISLSVSHIACGKICLEGGNCSSFFYNHETKACIASTQRYYANTRLSRNQGYGYYIMRPDCEADWTVIAGRCYLLRKDKKKFKDAQNKCDRLGGYLAKTDSLADDLIIRSFHNGISFWIGGTDEAEEGTWLWGDGTPITLNLWSPGKPDNKRYYIYEDEDCMIQRPRKWDDVRCRKKYFYLCEK